MSTTLDRSKTYKQAFQEVRDGYSRHEVARKYKLPYHLFCELCAANQVHRGPSPKYALAKEYMKTMKFTSACIKAGVTSVNYRLWEKGLLTGNTSRSGLVLSEQEASIMKMLNKGLSQAEVSRRIGKSRQYVNQVKRRSERPKGDVPAYA